ncbi:MAG: hypothetical protein IJH54_09135, partial [Clostridia bacterium]|nr:hypothetical protein [Clostridia bacterium]
MILAKDISPFYLVMETVYRTPPEIAMFHVKHEGGVLVVLPLFLFLQREKAAEKEKLKKKCSYHACKPHSFLKVLLYGFSY